MKKIILACAVVLLAIVIIALQGNIIDDSSSKVASSNEEGSDMFPRSSKQKFIKNKSDKPGEFLKYFHEISTRAGEKESGYKPNYRFKEYYKALDNRAVARTASAVNITSVDSRGPGNVGGRTRAVLVDPTDATHSTWYAGSASGGIWMTTDAGQSWTNLTPDLPNLSTNSMAMAVVDNGGTPQKIIYAGTGEGYAANYSFVRGDGIFKSTDGGATWTQLVNTAGVQKFKSVNRLIVNPTNANEVVAATNWGIYKTTDGGTNWVETYASANMVQDLNYDPTDFNIQYAGVNGEGIYKSVDGGNTWIQSSDGIASGARFEVAISPTNPNKIYTSTYTGAAGDETIVYVSADKAETWAVFVEEDGDDKDFLGEQGWYDNIITVHPFDENTVFIGGVYVGKYTFSGEITLSDPQFIGVDLINTGSFLTFVNFGATAYGGALEIGDGSNASAEFVNVEIRFGAGRQQKAHRFTVPADGGTNGDGGAGITDDQYTYQDYITVPFEVWDMDNNRQLMVSFRDQERDGEFDLNPQDDDQQLFSREYLFISNIPYSETPDPQITTEEAGHLIENMYFFWPVSTDTFDWGVDEIPTSTMKIKYGQLKQNEGNAEIVSDPRGTYGGKNGDLHADHHNLIMIPIDEESGEFWILNGNDGGLGLSKDGGETWDQILDGYVTTQFYGADKRPKRDQYFGGMQDNGTWMSGEDASDAGAEYTEELGGDGFEVIWHSKNYDKMMGSIYNNMIYTSTNGGQSWATAQNGINTNEGPFITRLASSRTRPETVFAVSSQGILKTNNFGGNWALKPIEEEWTLVNADNIPQITSQHDVKVSLANPDVVWAGGGLSDGVRKLFVSTDGGETFNAVENYPDAALGALSGLATHPTEENTAYALFSFATSPKILKTEDLGQTWVDISGYNTNNSVSTNGFPDVFVHSLLVMPHKPEVIWAGTEIGIFQSTDDGATWSYLDVGFPAVSVWSMKVVDDQVVIGTHGRGIWSITIPELALNQSLLMSSEYSGNLQTTLEVDLTYAYDSIKYFVNGEMVELVKNPAKGIQEVTLDIEPTNEEQLNIQFIVYYNNISYASEIQEIELDLTPEIISLVQNSEPDPLDQVQLLVDITENYDSLVVFVNDQRHEKIEGFANGELEHFITVPGIGTYEVEVVGYYGEMAFRSSAETVVITTVTGIFADAININSLSLYPNPANSTLNLELPSEINSEYQIEIFTLQGKRVYHQIGTFSVSSNQLNVSQLEKGIYLLTLKEEGKVYSGKFIKN